MPDDFIRDSETQTNQSVPDRRHRALFAMSDLTQLRGLHALRDALLSVLPLAAISTILYLVIAGIDLFSKPELINAVTSFAATGVEYDPEDFFALKFVSPYLTICALIPVFFAIAFTFELSRKYRSGDALPLSLISGVITFVALYSPMLFQEGESILDFPLNLMEENPQFLTGGVFMAIIIALMNYGIYRFCVQKGVATPLPVNVSDAIQGAFRVVLPGTISALIVFGLVFLFSEPFGQSVYYSSLWMTQNISNIYALMIIVMLVQIFAFFGIQGASSMYSIFWVLLLSASIDPPMWGHEESDPTSFATLSTVFFFVMIGGTGATLSLNLAMIRSGSNQVRKLGSMTFIPSLMNTNDLIIYGLPLAFNRHLLIPFFLVPFINLGITYGAFTSGFIQAPELFLPPYLPAPLGAFLACGADWRAIAVCLINILVGWAVYSYFLLPYDMKVRESEEIHDDYTDTRRFGL